MTGSGATEGIGDFRPIMSFAAKPAAKESVSAFEAEFGRGFFVFAQKKEQMASDAGVIRTFVGVPTVPDSGVTTSPIEYLVASLQPRHRGPAAEWISVGRASDSDIIIPDATVSSFHAAITDDGTRFWLQDGGSRNGTFADTQRVPERGQGDPVELRAGMPVSFGRIHVTFVGSDDLYVLIRRVYTRSADD